MFCEECKSKELSLGCNHCVKKKVTEICNENKKLKQENRFLKNELELINEQNCPEGLIIL